MPSETITNSHRAAEPFVRTPFEPEEQRDLRAQALEQLRRVRAFKMHALTFLLVTPALGTLWVLTEYFEEHTWPSRFADAPDVAGTWSPWFFWVAGIWFAVLAIHAARVYVGTRLHRAPTEAEIEREIGRLRAQR